MTALCALSPPAAAGAVPEQWRTSCGTRFAVDSPAPGLARCPSRSRWASPSASRWLDSTRQLLLRRPTPASRQPHVLARLPAARDDFVASVADIACSGELRQRLQHARSLRELWHLRAEVFERVSLHYDQGEAQARLARLNRHFPIRSPRSGFTPP